MSALLTERQKEVLVFIKQFVSREGVSPTVREIAAHFGFSSPLSAQLHVNTLLKKGLITKSPLRARNIRVIGQDINAGRSIPVLGKVRAGKPILAIEEAETHIAVDGTLFKQKDLFALSVTGDSMIEAGIFEGDIVIVRPEKIPANGSIAVVLIHDEVTIKKFFLEEKQIRLVPANKLLKPTLVGPMDVTILGKVVGVIRKL
jgi:repressor LexA